MHFHIVVHLIALGKNILTIEISDEKYFLYNFFYSIRIKQSNFVCVLRVT